jgi:hypothetical protein
MVASMITVFSVFALCSPVEVTNISEMLAATIIRVITLMVQAASTS